MFPGQRIFPENDYGKKKEAFFIMSALLLNSFEKKDSSKFLNSIKLSDINKAPSILQGSKNCLFFSSSAASTNTTICIEDRKEREDIIDSFNFLKKCIKSKPKSDNPVKINICNIKKRKNSQKEEGRIQHIKDILLTIENPNQQVFDIQKVRHQLIKALNKKGVIFKIKNLILFYL